jgi:hypothetical protein
MAAVERENAKSLVLKEARAEEERVRDIETMQYQIARAEREA